MTKHQMMMSSISSIFLETRQPDVILRNSVKHEGIRMDG